MSALIGILENIRRFSREREITDYVMPVWLPFVPVIISVAASILIIIGAQTRGMDAAMAGMGPAMGLAFLGNLIMVFVLYKWLKRRNEHFKRTKLMYSELASLFEKLGASRAATIRGIVKEMEVEQPERSPGFWVILCLFIPLLTLYVYHFLNKEFHKHSVRERHLAEDIRASLEELGVTRFPAEYPAEVPNRSTILYIILTIVTLGIFGLYWVYTLTKDPNEHFRSHRSIEKSLVSALERAVEEKLPPKGTAGAG